jgi:hypothetical protein
MATYKHAQSLRDALRAAKVNEDMRLGRVYMPDPSFGAVNWQMADAEIPC